MVSKLDRISTVVDMETMAKTTIVSKLDRISTVVDWCLAEHKIQGFQA